MSAVLKRAVLAVGLLLVGTVSAFAKQATIAGTVTDSSGGVLPGVTITIVHDDDEHKELIAKKLLGSKLE